MSPATVTEIRRGSAHHQRQVDLVRASLLRGVAYERETDRRAVRPLPRH